ncbi:MAG: DNA adenine methylase, partial [Endomicrobium sp.]|nr:DNA adenine methylase [Endomicrobium sp.]
MPNIIKRSPLFYIGDKYKLLKQLLPLFPARINNFYEPFIGGGSVFLNVSANGYILN